MVYWTESQRLPNASDEEPVLTTETKARNTQDAAHVFSTLPCLSTPRPNGSEALEETVAGVQRWLAERDIAAQDHAFTLRPYAMELLGLFMAGAAISLPIAALLGWGWAGPVLALFLILVPVLETRTLLPTVSALVRRQAQNLEVRFPAQGARREVLLCAHLDSKTELLDHAQRGVLLRLGTPAIGLALVCGALVVAQDLLAPGTIHDLVRWLGFGLGLVVAAYGLGMGANLAGGRLSRRPSSGAVDNGTAVAVLLDLAGRLQDGTLRPRSISVTLLFTVGEEAQMQGALAYVRDRKDWPLPTCVLNLEIVGQNGGFVLWRRDGTALQSLAADEGLNRALDTAVKTVTGQEAARAEEINSDAFAFLRAGIPATTLGSLDAELGERGFHSALDNAGRVDAGQLRETSRVVVGFLQALDAVKEQRET